jgi:hypothetical protein
MLRAHVSPAKNDVVPDRDILFSEACAFWREHCWFCVLAACYAAPPTWKPFVVVVVMGPCFVSTTFASVACVQVNELSSRRPSDSEAVALPVLSNGLISLLQLNIALSHDCPAGQ